MSMGLTPIFNYIVNKYSDSQPKNCTFFDEYFKLLPLDPSQLGYEVLTWLKFNGSFKKGLCFLLILILEIERRGEPYPYSYYLYQSICSMINLDFTKVRDKKYLLTQYKIFQDEAIRFEPSFIDEMDDSDPKQEVQPKQQQFRLLLPKPSQKTLEELSLPKRKLYHDQEQQSMTPQERLQQSIIKNKDILIKKSDPSSKKNNQIDQKTMNPSEEKKLITKEQQKTINQGKIDNNQIDQTREENSKNQLNLSQIDNFPLPLFDQFKNNMDENQSNQIRESMNVTKRRRKNYVTYFSTCHYIEYKKKIVNNQKSQIGYFNQLSPNQNEQSDKILIKEDINQIPLEKVTTESITQESLQIKDDEIINYCYLPYFFLLCDRQIVIGYTYYYLSIKIK